MKHRRAFLQVLVAVFAVGAFVTAAGARAQVDVVKFPPVKQIVHNTDWGEESCGGSSQDNCSAGQVVCGMRTNSSGSLNTLLCCDMSDAAKAANVAPGGAAYYIDEDSSNRRVSCYPGDCHDNARQVPRDALIGGHQWDGGNMNFGVCEPLRNATVGTSRRVGYSASACSGPPNTDYLCNADEVACGGWNYACGNSVWSGFLCCKVTIPTGAVEVDGEFGGTPTSIPFVLTGGLSVSGTTTYTNNSAPFGSYSVTVPASYTPPRGYSCTIENTINTTPVPCSQASSATINVTARSVTFTIKIGCTPKTCQNVVTSGAQCGTFPNGCELPGEPLSLQCGTCPPPQTCSATGQCQLPTLAVGCSALPAPQAVGAPVTYTAAISGGIGPFDCSWSGNTQVSGETTCGAFTATFAAAGTYTATLAVTDNGASPPRTGSGSCNIDILPPAPPRTLPPANVPEVDLCQAFKVVQLYGIPLTGFMILLSGYYVFTSLGDPRKLKKGKSALTASVVGLVVLIFAKPIFAVIMSFLGFQMLLCGVLVP